MVSQSRSCNAQLDLGLRELMHDQELTHTVLANTFKISYVRVAFDGPP